MIFSSQIRRIALVAVVGCAILACWTSAAAARPIDDPLLPNARIAEPRADASDDGGISTLPIALAAVVVLVGAGTGGYAYRTRTSRRAIA